MNPTNLKVIAVAVAGALLFAAGWLGNGWRMGEQLAELKAENAAEQRNQAVFQTKAIDDARIEEQRRTAAQTEIANVAKQDADIARADARAADDTAGRLRQRIDQLLAAARAAKDPGTAGGGQGQQSGDPLDVLVDVLGRSDKTSGILADYADQLKVAGLACERSYDALSGGVEVRTATPM